MRSLCLLVLLAGCGGAPTTPAEPPEPSGIIEVSTGEAISFETLVERLAAARVVYVGERHDREDDHAAQRRILEALTARDPELAVGFEMFQRPYQEALDEYAAGTLDEAELLERTEWETRWGYDFAMYRPLVTVGRAGHRLVALNAPQELTRAIAREGVEALDDEQRAALPELTRDDETYRARIVEALAHHPHMDEAMLERFFTAQLVWDETMAETVAAHAGRMLVFAGVMHVAREAIPARAARRGAAPYAIVMPADELDDDAPADYVWLTPAGQ